MRNKRKKGGTDEYHLNLSDFIDNFFPDLRLIILNPIKKLMQNRLKYDIEEAIRRPIKVVKKPTTERKSRKYRKHKHTSRSVI